ncbi:uncharacterized protein LOC129257742 isoform X2 [Lytechinus pictus]|uniref:uncharacterized protein LOC129257742 isoform X2 n=1 Tax=Lytechinus pictus TaxID=7653 RepID=UPI0030B9D96A
MKLSRLLHHSWILLVHCLWRNVSGLACSRIIEGSMGSEGEISAPLFPSSYPREDSFYTCTYRLRNRNLTNLRLVFSDFHLDDDIAGGFKNGTRDYLQIDLHDGQTPRVYVGINRPTIILSSSDEITLTLGVQANQPNIYPGLRTFAAQYSFITASQMIEYEAIYTDSRTVIPTLSMDQGNVAYTVLAPMGYVSGFYSSLEIDIIWYIEAESHMKVLFIVDDFTKSNADDTSSLAIHDGLTSEAPPLYVAPVAPRNHHIKSTQEYLYVRWKGRTAVESSFEAYFTFFIQAGGGMQCPGDYFPCDNDHCISQGLTCNMRDNCGDNSDEESTTVCLGRTTTSPSCSPMCINSGICINGACVCPADFYGELCQFRNGSNSDFTDLQHTSIMIGAFVGAVCLLSVCWLIAMARKRYQDEPAPGTGRHQRIVSVHTLEEAGLRRNTTITDNQDIPPEYSIACRRDSRRGSRQGSFAKRYRPSIDSMGPLSPPPAYEVVAGEVGLENYDGIAFRIPEVEERNLPDVVNRELMSATPAQPPPPAQQQTVYHETEIHDEPQQSATQSSPTPPSSTTPPPSTSSPLSTTPPASTPPPSTTPPPSSPTATTAKAVPQDTLV